jgi:hypothetical protein
MKFREGERLQAKVEEVLAGNELVVIYDGQYLRVINDSGRKFQPGHLLHLIVVGVSPLKLQLYSQYMKKFDRFA